MLVSRFRELLNEYTYLVALNITLELVYSSIPAYPELWNGKVRQVARAGGQIACLFGDRSNEPLVVGDDNHAASPDLQSPHQGIQTLDIQMIRWLEHNLIRATEDLNTGLLTSSRSKI